MFDLDGTLIDTIGLILASMRHTTEVVLGEALADDVLMHNVGVPLVAQMHEFASFAGRDADIVDRMVAVYREHNALVHDELVREYPGVEAALKRIAASGRRMGIVTSKARVVAMRGLERFGLERFFDIIIASDDVAIHKPDPHPLLVAAAGLGTPISHCAYVGDSPHDMTAAVAAGCVSIAAVWGVASRERVLEPGPDFVAESMEDVALIFEGDYGRFRVDE